MKREFLDLPTWEFDIDEVSAGVYEVTGRDKLGHRVSAKGIDPESLFERCRKEASILSMTGSAKNA